ncbi:hypothetical protein ACK3SF_01445 [Candidatus Nanosalina sp. VS9-1]|uniref:hypothetical protein n=1 Tax=Candidatus Nanosalina sp. VS9-1 TaxID=3388566 RepID=UPI0039E058AE
MKLSEYAEMLLEQPKQPQDGNMNEVSIGKHRVARKYNDPPLVQQYVSNFFDEGYGQKGDERIENSREAYRNRGGIGFRVPEIIHSDGVIEEVEMVQGSSLEEYVLSGDREEVEDIAGKFAEALKETHENGFAIRDCRLENFIYEDCSFSDENYIAAVDTEWFEADASEEDIADDLRGLAVNISQLPEDTRREFRQAFEENYGESLENYVTTRAKRDMVIETTRDNLAKRDFNKIKNTLQYLTSR